MEYAIPTYNRSAAVTFENILAKNCKISVNEVESLNKIENIVAKGRQKMENLCNVKYDH